MLLEFRASNAISGRKKWSVFLFLIISNLNFCSFRLSGNTALAQKKETIQYKHIWMRQLYQQLWIINNNPINSSNHLKIFSAYKDNIIMLHQYDSHPFLQKMLLKQLKQYLSKYKIKNFKIWPFNKLLLTIHNASEQMSLLEFVKICSSNSMGFESTAIAVSLDYQ